MAKSKRESMDVLSFVKVFAPMAKEGKSALEIGQALGIEGDSAKVAQFVSVKASQLRARLAKAARAKAAKNGLSAEDAEKLAVTAAGLVPKLKSHGRKSGTDEIMSTLEGILNSVNGDTE